MPRPHSPSDYLFTLGGELRNEELESTSLVKGKDDVIHEALFIQDEFSLIGDRLLMTPGVRWDDHEAFGSEVSPRLYVLYKLTDKVNLKAGYGHAFRAPTIKQVSEGYHATAGPHEFFGNPDVKPEIADSYEVGAAPSISAIRFLPEDSSFTTTSKILSTGR